LASFGHPSKFQRVSRLGSVTVRHSNSGRQSNFAALNRGHRLYSAGIGIGAHFSSVHLLVAAVVSFSVGLFVETAV